MTTALTDHVVALWRLQSRYADVVTRRAWPELHDLFLPDTTVHIDTVTSPSRSIVGPEAFGSFVGAAIERFDHFAFVILNTVVDVDEAGTGATGRIFMCEIRHDTATDTWQNAHGVYTDRYVFVEDDGAGRPGGWRFAERRYRSMARTGPDGVVFGLPPGATTGTA
jgi:SnoaL-like domain